MPFLSYPIRTFRTGSYFEDCNTISGRLIESLVFRTGTNFEDYNTSMKDKLSLVPFRTGYNLEDCNTLRNRRKAIRGFRTGEDFEDYNTEVPPFPILLGFALVYISRTTTLIAHEHYTAIV